MSDINEDIEGLSVFPMDEEQDSRFDEEITDGQYPLLPLRNTVLLPSVIIPITVGREQSLKAAQKAYSQNRLIAVFAQKEPDIEEPSLRDLHRIGTLARVIKILKMPNGNTTVIIQGRKRCYLEQIEEGKNFPTAEIILKDDISPRSTKKLNATFDAIREAAINILEFLPNVPPEAETMLQNISNPVNMVYLVINNLGLKPIVKQAVLAETRILQRAEMVLEILMEEAQRLQFKSDIENKVRHELDKQQRDYYLNQHLKTIQEELGEGTSGQELHRLEERGAKKQWSAAVRDVFQREIKKLKRMNPAQPDYGIVYNYVELLLDLPWNEYSTDNFDLKQAAEVLEKDHFGLEKVKERILEHLAVLKLKGDMSAPILCLVGPPGVGKTSLGKSVAEALKRKYIRIALGGLHDESEIRGHRKTYIGAMPGRIIQSIKKAGTSNPVFILDEIDKIGRDFRGDPASALLEALDPQQNSAFYDNYLETEFDLSKVLFIATANTLNGIHPALLDRMEVIYLSGYSLEEKVEIAKRHLLPEQLAAHGIKPKHLKLKDEVLTSLVERYTREAGVRELSRKLGGVCRNIAKRVAIEEDYKPSLTYTEVTKILGAESYNPESYTENLPKGVAVGLAWTSVGGDILYIETSLSKGKGGLTLTGNLGDVMKESTHTALSFLRANADLVGLDSEVFEQHSIHVHVPEGAIPKDGPSAGITMLSSLASAFTGRPLRSHLAMTGEITLRGRVLPVGGIKEKILAAKRAGIREIILSQDNQKHIAEIPAIYIEGVSFHYVKEMQEVLQLALSAPKVN